MSSKENKMIAPNEYPVKTWIVTIIVGVVIGFAFSIVAALIFTGPFSVFKGTWFEYMEGAVSSFASLATMYWGMVIAIKCIAKVSIKDFIFGKGGKINGKESGIIILLYLAGFGLSLLLSIGNIFPREIEADRFVVYLLFMLAIVWMQTTFEEVVFRGIPTRLVCKNNIVMSKKVIVAGIVSSALFMVMHLANPEVTTAAPSEVFPAALSYFISGMGLFFVNIYFRNIFPGVLIHWLNNFIFAILLSNVVSAVNGYSLFLDSSGSSGWLVLAQTVMIYVPVYIYIFAKSAKAKKQAK